MVHLLARKGRSSIPQFQAIISRMEPLFEELEGSRLYTWTDLRGVPKSGVYVFYEDGSPIYVGRSNNMLHRIKGHGASSSRHYTATFAFKLYREAIGNPPGTRQQVQALDPAEYERQRQRVRSMTIRAVEVTDQRIQTVFETYVVLALDTTRYNTFETH